MIGLAALILVVGAMVVISLIREGQRSQSVSPKSSTTMVARSESTPPTSSVAPTTLAPTTTLGPLGSGEPVTIVFAGDSHFESHLRTKLDNDPTGMLNPLLPLFAGADLTVLNLETAITEGGTAAPKTYTFRAPPSAFDALAAAGVDVVSMANNHGMDYGPEGFADSLAAAERAGFPVIGVGNTIDEAFAPYLTTIRGQTIAVISATQVLDDSLASQWTATADQPGLASAKDVDRLVRAVTDIRDDANTVVVFLHWGREREICPIERQTDLARRLVDAGADIVVGGHAHRLQGAGRMDDALVAYGLGNFIWYNERGEGSKSGALAVTVTGRRIDAYEWRPARISGGIPRPLEGQEREAALAEWNGLRDCTGLSE